MRAELKTGLHFGAALALVLAFTAPAAPTGATGIHEATAFQQDAVHDGVSTDTLAAQPQQAWVAHLNGTASYPLIEQGVAVVAVSPEPCCGAGPSLYAFDLQTGAPKWGPEPLGGYYSFAGITADTTSVYAISSFGANPGDAPILRSFDLMTGATHWTTSLPGGQWIASSAPTVANGVVYAAASGDGGTLYAVNASTGAVLWSQSVENGDSSSPAVTSTGVYVSYACEQAYDFSPTTGAQVWHHSTSCEGGGGRTPVYAQGRVFIRDDAGMTPVALDAATGTAGRSFVSKTPPAIVGKTMLTLVGPQTLGAPGVLTATRVGNKRAKWKASGDGTLITAPIVVGQTVFVAGASGKVFAYDLTRGKLLWSADTGSAIEPLDEHNQVSLVGLAEGEHTLLVPAGNTLVAYR